ncbi:1218_t:CDS:2 [Acaulospora morrowiae]|uniref:1218_t:CDS:1 n=1 Tax=Acaulospora morrowiae TaxID=94023 RepID=A0A9N9A4J5_9GLOM|nr:1218_t:CDS:2 [Acaulospora morrowiae]
MNAIITDVAYLLTACAVTYVAHYYYKYFTRESPLPGPFPLPLIGSLHKIHGNIDKYCTSCQKKYGDMFELWICSQRLIFLGNAEVNEKLFVGSLSKSNFTKRSVSENFEALGFSRIGLVFNNDSSSWNYNRKLIEQALMKPSFLRNLMDDIQCIYEEMEGYWKIIESKEPGAVHDMADWCIRFTTDITFYMSTSKHAYCMASYFNKVVPDHKINVPGDAVNESEEFASRTQTYIDSLNFWYFWSPFTVNYIPGFSYMHKKYKDNIKWLYDRIYKLIYARRAEIKKISEDVPLRPDILTLFITANTERELEKVKGVTNRETLRPMTDDEICYNIFDITEAGIDTAANAMCFTIYFLSKYPEHKQKVHEELDSVLGPNHDRRIAYEDLDKLQYLEAVIKESLRHIPIIPFAFKISDKDDFIGGKFFRGGQVFFVSFSGIHNNKKDWPDTEKFDPTRFLNPIGKNTFLPFGGGPRICPGRHIGMMEIKTFLASVYRKFDVNLADPNAPANEELGFVNHCKKCEVRITPRNC